MRPTKGSPVEVQIMGSNSLDILHARDISPTGVGVYVPHCFEGCNIDAEVELVITLPRTRTFLARGVIRHVSAQPQTEQYFGLEFTQIADRNRDQICSYVELLEASD